MINNFSELEKLKKLAPDELKKNQRVIKLGKYNHSADLIPIKTEGNDIFFLAHRKEPSIKDVLDERFGNKMRISVLGTEDEIRAGKFFEEASASAGIKSGSIEGKITEPRDLLVENIRKKIKGDTAAGAKNWDTPYSKLSEKQKKIRGNLAALTVAHYRMLKEAVGGYKIGKKLMDENAPGSLAYKEGKELVEKNSNLFIMENNAGFGFKSKNGTPTMDGASQYLQEALSDLPDNYSAFYLMQQDYFGENFKAVGNNTNLIKGGYPSFTKGLIVNVRVHGEAMLKEFEDAILSNKDDLLPSDHMWAQIANRNGRTTYGLRKQLIHRMASESLLSSGKGASDYYFAPDIGRVDVS